ncbi:hypothetical protein NDU88_004214 [Pleurodeles waltl]|uniref:Uncharacterized protein n=1 Tax=Pleurodeles waltl TaxID=8319 RepID=A0AAV7MG17_PLEWA|nr:hypothetical protein NDU88_004214 [Pleurodeles waltl]
MFETPRGTLTRITEAHMEERAYIIRPEQLPELLEEKKRETRGDGKKNRKEETIEDPGEAGPCRDEAGPERAS